MNAKEILGALPPVCEQKPSAERTAENLFKNVAIIHLVQGIVGHDRVLELLHQDRGIDHWLAEEGRRISLSALRNDTRLAECQKPPKSEIFKFFGIEAYMEEEPKG